jgi:hypothetical protein
LSNPLVPQEQISQVDLVIPLRVLASYRVIRWDTRTGETIDLGIIHPESDDKSKRAQGGEQTAELRLTLRNICKDTFLQLISA